MRQRAVAFPAARQGTWTRRHGREAGICALLFVATLAYLACWPHDFYVFDEGVYLYGSKRVLDGQVMYRDFFEIATPGSFYLMAGLYAVFGVSLDTARAALAVIHGLIGVLTYLICRRFGVRPLLAVLVALLHLTLGFPAHTTATPHWLSTPLTLLLVLIVVDRPCTTARRALLWGAISGLLILVQQQRGVIVAAGAALVLAWDGAHAVGRPFRRRAAGFAAGVLAVVVPVMLGFVIAAGVDNVARALVLHPIRRYPRTSHGRGGWGTYIPLIHPLGFIISNLPLILPVGLAAALWQWRRGLAWPQRRALVVAVIFAVFGLLSVSYNPNYYHFVLLAPLWFALAALLLELSLSRPSAVTRALRPITAMVTVGLILGACWQLAHTLLLHRGWLPVRSQTAFGRVDFAHDDDVRHLQWLTELLHRHPGAAVFAYPTIPGLYLLTGTENPTRFQIMVPDYTERDQLEEIVAVLETRRVRYVILGLYPDVSELEPLHSYVQQHYERLAGPRLSHRPAYVVFQRRLDPAGPGPT